MRVSKTVCACAYWHNIPTEQLSMLVMIKIREKSFSLFLLGKKTTRRKSFASVTIKEKTFFNAQVNLENSIKLIEIYSI